MGNRLRARGYAFVLIGVAAVLGWPAVSPSAERGNGRIVYVSA